MKNDGGTSSSVCSGMLYAMCCVCVLLMIWD